MGRRVSEDFSRQIEVPSDGEESCGKSSQGTSRKQLLLEMLRVVFDRSVVHGWRTAVKTCVTQRGAFERGRNPQAGRAESLCHYRWRLFRSELGVTKIASLASISASWQSIQSSIASAFRA